MKSSCMKSWILLYIASLLIGCSPAVQVEKSPDTLIRSYKTYRWINKDSLNRKLELLDRNVKASGDYYLERKGLSESDHDPDLLFEYDVLVERANRERIASVYDPPFFRPFFNPYTRMWGTIYYPIQFSGTFYFPETVTEGTITLSAIDAKTNKTVWQGWSTEILNSRNITAKEIDRIVKGIIQKFK